MLPEMVRKLALFQALGKRTYVHCTAGINRASLTVLGYLTFVNGMDYDAALEIVKKNRPQANPYVYFPNTHTVYCPSLTDTVHYMQITYALFGPITPACLRIQFTRIVLRTDHFLSRRRYAVSWNIARARLIAERNEDVYLHTVVDQGGNTSTEGGDWIARDLNKAHVGVIQSIFQRAVETDLSLVDALRGVEHKA